MANLRQHSTAEAAGYTGNASETHLHLPEQFACNLGWPVCIGLQPKILGGTVLIGSHELLNVLCI